MSKLSNIFACLILYWQILHWKKDKDRVVTRAVTIFFIPMSLFLKPKYVFLH